MFTSAKQGREAGRWLADCYRETSALLAPEYGDWAIFEHCLPFDVIRCYVEAVE